MAFEGLFGDLQDRWAEIPKWQKWIGYLLLLVIFSFILKIKVIDPLNMEIARIEREVASKRIKVAKLKAVEKRKEELAKEIALLKEKIEELESKLPTGREEVSNIIKSIAANIKGIKVLSIKRGKRTSEKYYDKISYEVLMDTRYPNFLSWCEGISKADRILTFGDVTFNALLPKKEDKEVEVNGKKIKDVRYSYKYTTQIKLKLDAYTLKR